MNKRGSQYLGGGWYFFYSTINRFYCRYKGRGIISHLIWGNIIGLGKDKVVEITITYYDAFELNVKGI